MSLDSLPSPQAPALPYNIEAEQGLLAAVLNHPDAYEAVADFLEPEHFADDIHQGIFEAAGRLIQAGKNVSAITLKNLFEREEVLGEMGGSEYLAKLQHNLVTVRNAQEYGRLILDLYIRRQLIVSCMDVMEVAAAVDLDRSGRDIVDGLGSELMRLGEVGMAKGDMERIGELVDPAIASVRQAQAHDGPLAGLATGFVDLDEKIGGLESPSLAILAARPSMGKTALALATCERICKRGAINGEGGNCLFFSLEMGKQQLMQRTLATLSGINVQRMRQGKVSADQLRMLEFHGETARPWPLYIDDSAALTVQQMHLRARRLKRTAKGLALVVIDHLQFVKPDNKKASRTEQLEQICHDLRAMAKDLDVPILALSQLSRAVEQRPDKRPQLSDLRMSGDIEQDADVVMFIFRQAYYVERKGPGLHGDESVFEKYRKEDVFKKKLEPIQHLAEIDVAKQRNGPIGLVKLFFDATSMRFDNWSDDTPTPEEGID